jgi:hypothetical protein
MAANIRYGPDRMRLATALWDWLLDGRAWNYGDSQPAKQHAVAIEKVLVEVTVERDAGLINAKQAFARVSDALTAYGRRCYDDGRSDALIEVEAGSRATTSRRPRDLRDRAQPVENEQRLIQ